MADGSVSTGSTGGGGGFSGDYNDLTNKPTIPTNNNHLTNGAGYITSSSLSGYLTASDLNGYATQSWVSGNYQPKGSYLTATPTFQQVTTAGARTNQSPSAPNWFTQNDGYTLGGTVSGGARVIISNGLTYSNTSNVGVFTVDNSGNATAAAMSRPSLTLGSRRMSRPLMDLRCTRCAACHSPRTAVRALE